jgi:hypothetical protein
MDTNLLLTATITLLKQRNIEFNHNIIGLACKYYPSSRIETYTELKKIVRSSELISDILNIYDCMKDPAKVPFPKFTEQVQTLREAIADL